MAGSFTQYDGVANQNRLTRLHTTGDRDATFVLPGSVSIGFDATVRDVLQDSSDYILAVGDFNAVGENVASRVALLSGNGGYEGAFVGATGFDNTAYAAEIVSGSQYFIFGDFDNYKGSTNQKVIKLNNAGTPSQSFVTGFNDQVNVVVPYGATSYIVGGNFTGYSTRSPLRAMKIDDGGGIDITFIDGRGLFCQGRKRRGSCFFFSGAALMW